MHSAAHPGASTSPTGLDRRTVLKAGALAGAAVGTSALAGRSAVAGADVGVFRHGVASGDPMPDRVILWTRVTPAPDAVPGSGRGAPVAVSWEISLDPGFSQVVRSGSVVTDAGRDHTVKFDCTGLAPDRWYHYR
ncbi:MAG: PhoD-like phosphatase N-terminal domain-containing protein, partial [Dietzia cercidiphylli]